MDRMADKPETTDAAKDETCVACDIAWNFLMAAGAGLIALIAWDVLSQGKASEYLSALLDKFRPKMGSLTLLRSDDGAAVDTDAS
jgi:hypothetical protein